MKLETTEHPTQFQAQPVVCVSAGGARTLQAFLWLAGGCWNKTLSICSPSGSRNNDWSSVTTELSGKKDSKNKKGELWMNKQMK